MRNFAFSESNPVFIPVPQPQPAKPPGKRQALQQPKVMNKVAPVSFRDKVLGNKKAPPPREKSDLLDRNLQVLSLRMGIDSLSRSILMIVF